MEHNKKRGIPKTQLNPQIAPMLVCQERVCRKLLSPLRAEEKDGQLKVVYYCEDCGYDFHLSPQYAHGDYSAHAEEVKRPPEVMQRPAMQGK